MRPDIDHLSKPSDRLGLLITTFLLLLNYSNHARAAKRPGAAAYRYAG